jgi:protein AFG1
MPKDSQTLYKVTYKPDPQSTEEFIILVNKEEYTKWKDGDRSIPLVEVVDSFTVLHSGQGSQGLLGQASKQQQEAVFGTSKDDEVVKFMLEKGTLQPGDALTRKWTGTNNARGGYTIDTRGQGGSHN